MINHFFVCVCVSLLLFRQSHLLDFTSTTPTQQNCVLVYSASSASRISNVSNVIFVSTNTIMAHDLGESRGFCSGSVAMMHHSLSRVYRPWAPSHLYEVWHIWRCEINRGTFFVFFLMALLLFVMSIR